MVDGGGGGLLMEERLGEGRAESIGREMKKKNWDILYLFYTREKGI